MASTSVPGSLRRGWRSCHSLVLFLLPPACLAGAALVQVQHVCVCVRREHTSEERSSRPTRYSDRDLG